MSPHIFLFKFCIWRDFKNKSNVCHVLCEGLFMLDVRYRQVDAETEFDNGIADSDIFIIAQMLRNFARIFTKSKLLGMRLHPRLLHQCYTVQK